MNNEYEIVIFSGTTEGRMLSEFLVKNKIKHIVYVATEYGKMVMERNEYALVFDQRLDKNQMIDMFNKNQIKVVIDSTHPYAKIVTENIKKATRECNIKYIRLKRAEENVIKKYQNNRHIHFFDTINDCVESLKKTSGNILLTTGSKDLHKFCCDENIKDRLIVRVLPGKESIEICDQSGIKKNRIIAIQGPFSYEMNCFFIKNYDIKIMVSKESGKVGGFDDKIKSSIDSNIDMYIIKRPKEEGKTFEEVVVFLSQELNVKLSEEQETQINKEIQNNLLDSLYSQETTKTPESSQDLNKKVNFDITLAGIGVGAEKFIINELKNKIEEADIILGAKRMIDDFTPKIEKKPYYSSNDIISYLKKISYLDNSTSSKRVSELGDDSIFNKEKSLDNSSFQREKTYKVVVLFSGDVGFYSGCYLLKDALEKEKDKLSFNLKVLPGISSIVYMASKCYTTWHDAKILSIHGRYDEIYGDNEILENIKYNKKTFMIVSGKQDVKKIGQLIIDADDKYFHAKDIEITIGYNLSYPDEIVKKCKAQDCLKVEKEGLYVLYIENKACAKHINAPMLKDSAFIRDKIPMTKEEIRHIVINKLQLKEDSIFFDIGGGTGSISIEAAMLDRNIKVFTFENNVEAVRLIEKNIEHFGRKNVKVIEGIFPEIMMNKPNDSDSITNECRNYIIKNKNRITSAFIGGTRGRLLEMIEYLYSLNNTMKICITAVTLESINQVMEIIKKSQESNMITDVDISQISYSKVKKIGNYNMFKAENPIMIFTFSFKSKE